MVSRKCRETDLRREIIAAAAYKLFATNPYETVTVENIAREAEFGKGTIYQYFSSKDEILVFIICQGIDRLCVEIDQHCVNEADIHIAMDKLIELQYKFYGDYRHLILSLMRRNPEGYLSEDLPFSIEGSRQLKREMSASVIDRGIKEGTIIDKDSLYLARGLDNAIRGFGLSRNIEPHVGENEQQKELELIKIMLLKGIFR